ncbi:CpaF family protein [Ectobacillus ponti]|uniref:CpaF family protein n=1 Tax=Ectobacillus ponti TaxID=2961894 RepID=A0AA42BQE8_9BACI|nr:CpaF family protein [Ectobacillus ponti]MCP8969326.1 CpaF family protein [Ectobacillus ponti]
MSIFRRAAADKKEKTGESQSIPKEISAAVQTEATPVVKPSARKKEFLDIQAQMHAYLMDEIKKYAASGEQERTKVRELGQAYLDEEGSRLTFEEKQEVLQLVEHELLAYGPITPLLEDPQVTEIMVNGPSQIYYEKRGKLYGSEASFQDHAHVLRVIERIVAPIGRRVDESSPMVDARLPDGSRVNVIIPPLSLKGPSITIRKFSARALEVEDLIRYGTLSEEMSQFLNACVKSRLNIFISGGTGAGKTTLLNVMSSFIPHDERIITIEDAAELRLSQEHVLPLEARPANIEGRGQVTIRELVRNALRMRPDRIVVGEVRGAETLDMLQAMNTGHDGSLSTGHANSPRDMLSRLETMVLMAGIELPVRAIREQIASAIDIIVHQSRMKDGARRVTHITEVLGMEGDTIVLQDLFLFEETGRTADGAVTGAFVSAGIRPKIADQLELNGFKLPASWFMRQW